MQIFTDPDFDFGNCVLSASGSAVSPAPIVFTTNEKGEHLAKDDIAFAELMNDYGEADDSLPTILDDSNNYIFWLKKGAAGPDTFEACGPIYRVYNSMGKRYYKKYFAELDD